MAVAWVLLLSSLAVSAQTPAAQAPAAPERKSDPRVQQAAAQHRTIAQAHEKAAFCLESGAPEKTCQEALQQACRGIAIGRYCGMKRSRQASAGTP